MPKCENCNKDVPELFEVYLDVDEWEKAEVCPECKVKIELTKAKTKYYERKASEE